jgi:hypothetical protein
VLPGKGIRTAGAALGVGDFRPFSLRGASHDFNQPLPVSLGLAGGFRRSLGLFGEARALLPLRPGLGLGAELGLYTARGVMFGPAARYADPSPDDRWTGTLSSGYIRDHGDRLTDLLGRPIAADRGHLSWSHRQSTTGGTTIAAQLNWWSDSEVLRDFRPRAFFPVQVPDSFVEITHPGPNSFLTFLTRLQPKATRFSFPNHELSSRKSQAVVIDDRRALAPEWLAITTTSNPDKAAIKEALKAGRAPFALGRPRFRSSVIRPRQRLVTPTGAAAGSLKALLARQIIAEGIPA